MVQRVAVIGAGAAGTCAARHLIGAGFEVTVFEAGSHVGGLWVYENDNGRAQAYRRLSIITSRRYTQFPDFPFDERTPRFPTHWDMARYFDQYAEHFGVKARTRFRTRVTRVEPCFEPGARPPRWRVTTDDGDADEFDVVVVATGHLNEPLHDPRLPEFGGQYLHSQAYRTATAFADRRVCVVGLGNSGADIASDVCASAERTVVVVRSGVTIYPKVVFGIPYSDIAIGLRRRWLPEPIRNRLYRFFVYAAHGDQRRLGIPRPTRSAHPTLSESLIMNIEYNRIAVKPDIESIDDRKITFVDGTSEEFDVVVGATGYRVSLPFLAPDIVPVDGNHVDLYQRMFVPDWPGLAFVGMIAPNGSLNQVIEPQSRLLVDYVAGRLTLPPPERMWASIRARNAQNRAVFHDSPRHEMREPDFAYLSELRRLARTAQR
jgi:dimethylaniline monooxygenase (N-oxide forming)